MTAAARENLGTAHEGTGGYVGLTNQGATCYLNSLLQTLFMTPEFTREVFRWRLDPDASAEERTRSIPHQLQMLFARLLTSECRAISTVGLTKSFCWDGDQVFVQHDVQELCRLLFDALEEAFAGTADVTRLFRGQLIDFLACKPPHTHTSTRSDAFLDLQVAVRGFGSIRPIASVIEGLRFFLKPESLDGANQYELAPGQKVDAWKGLRLAQLPPLLMVHLKRFEMDYATMRNVKVNDRVSFSQTLSFAKKCEQDCAKASQHAGCAEAWDPVEPEQRAGECDGPTELVEYELYSVLVHAGTATSGHYFAYIKDLSRSSWLKFDDATVSTASWADVESTFGVSVSSTSMLREATGAFGGGGGSLFGTSSTVPPIGLRSTTAYMLTYRRKSSANSSASTSTSNVGGHEAQSDTAATPTEAVDDVVYAPGGTDPLDPRAVEVPEFLKQALEEEAAAEAAAEAARVERESLLSVVVLCSHELLQQLQLPLHLPQQIAVTFRCGDTAGMLLAEVGLALQRLHPEAVDTNSTGGALLTPKTAQVCLLDLKENIIRLRFQADDKLDPKALSDSRRGSSTPFVYALLAFYRYFAFLLGRFVAVLSIYFLEPACPGWYFGDGEPPKPAEMAVMNAREREVSVTLLHATAGDIVGRCDVTLGNSPSELQVRRAAAARFGLELVAGIQIFRGQSMIAKDFVPMPTAADASAGVHSWEGMKWDAHPYLVVTTATERDQCGEKAGERKWMNSAVAHAMTVRVLFTELDEPEEGDKDTWIAEGGSNDGGPLLATHSLLFDARQNTDELKRAMAAVLNQSLASAGSSESEQVKQVIDPTKFNAFLKMGAKETVLNRPTAPPFQLARFRSGFSRLPCCIPLRLVRGRAADLRTRTLALRWHVPGAPGVSMWTETVNAAELSLQGCKEWLLASICAEENAKRLPSAACDAVKAASKLLQHPQHQVGLRLRMYDTTSAQMRPGKALTSLPGTQQVDGVKLSALIPPSDVAVPVGVTLLHALPLAEAFDPVGSGIQATTDDAPPTAHDCASAGTLASEQKLSTGGCALVTLYRWLAASAGELGPATEIVVEASISAAGLCEVIAQAVGTKGQPGAEHIELVRHWPRAAAVGPSQVIGKSWSRDAFDATILSAASGGSQTASPRKRSRFSKSEDDGGDDEDECLADDILRDGDAVYWRDSRESAASTIGGGGTSGACEQQPKKKKAKQQSILSLFGGFKTTPTQLVGEQYTSQ